MTGLGNQRAGLALVLALAPVACEQALDDDAGLVGLEAAAELTGGVGLTTTREDVEWVHGLSFDGCSIMEDIWRNFGEYDPSRGLCQDGERLAALLTTVRETEGITVDGSGQVLAPDRRERQASFWRQRIAGAATEEQRDALAGLARRMMTEREGPR
jgi:hypothetical protein